MKLWRGLGRVGAAVVLMLLVSGCGTLGGDNRPSTLDLQLAGIEAVAGSRGHVFGHGTGPTRTEARQAALAELAQMLLAQVRSEVQSLERELQTEENGRAVRQLTRELSVATISFAEVELEGALVDSERHGADGWYVRLRLAEAGLHELRARARRTAPVLARLEAVAATPEELPGRRLRLALRGLAATHELQLEHAPVYQPGLGRTSFGAFFETAALQSAERLRVLPVVEGEGLRFVVIDSITFSPQPNVTLEAAGQELSTDRDGYTPWVSFAAVPEPVVIKLLGYPLQSGAWHHPAPALLPSDSFSRYSLVQSRQAKLYVHSVPPGAVVRVGSVETVTPALFTVTSGRPHVVTMLPQDGLHGADHRLNVPAGAPAAYLSVWPDQRRLGRVQLRTDGRQARIEVTGVDYHARADGSEFDALLEVGRYSVRVSHRDGDRYETIVDTLSVLEGSELQRQYRAPRYRQPYRSGMRLGLAGLRVGGQPRPDYRLPWFNGEQIRYEQLASQAVATDANEDPLSLDLLLVGQRYFNRGNLTVQGALGQRVHRLELEQAHRPETTELALHARHLSLGVGFWVGGDRAIASLTANRAWESVGWASRPNRHLQRDWGGAWEKLPADSLTSSYSFLELNTQLRLRSAFGDRYGLSLSLVAPAATLRPYLMIGFGFGLVERRYRYGPQVEARQGVHF